jgi:hypothetical protein
VSAPGPTPPRAVRVHIESLELVGFVRHDAPRIAAALERELARRLAAAPLDPARLGDAAAERLDAGTIRLDAKARPETTGRRLAEKLDGTLRP